MLDVPTAGRVRVYPVLTVPGATILTAAELSESPKISPLELETIRSLVDLTPANVA